MATDCTAGSTKYPQIGKCGYQVYNGIVKITFICIETVVRTDFFEADGNLVCQNWHTYYKGSIEAIKFQDCELAQLQNNFFAPYSNLHTFDISGIDLESLQMDTFVEAKNLKNLIASHNKIAEIPAYLLHKSDKLTSVDFSFNKINRIDLFAFTGDFRLEHLNLSHNNISRLNKKMFSDLLNLEYLDISHNVISTVNDQTFENFTELLHLDLSVNSFGNLNVNTFATLTKLRHLNLSHVGLKTIKASTFSHQSELETLDLSGNNLKTLDSVVFAPEFTQLKSLHIGRNQLRDLNGFTSSKFHNLTIFGIRSNQFNCSFLEEILKIMKLKQLDLLVDSSSKHANGSFVNEMKCNSTDIDRSDENKDMNIDRSDDNINHNDIKVDSDSDSSDIYNNNYQSMAVIIGFIWGSVATVIVIILLILRFIERPFNSNLATVTYIQRQNNTRIPDNGHNIPILLANPKSSQNSNP